MLRGSWPTVISGKGWRQGGRGGRKVCKEKSSGAFFVIQVIMFLMERKVRAMRKCGARQQNQSARLRWRTLKEKKQLVQSADLLLGICRMSAGLDIEGGAAEAEHNCR